jgi:hypothetical protein
MLQYTQSDFPTMPTVRARLSRSMTKRQRIDYALAVIDGQRPFPPITKAVVARACGVSPSSLYHARNGQRELSDADIDRFIARAGVEKVFAALDRHTSPQLAAE